MDFPAVELEIQTALILFDKQETTINGIEILESSGLQNRLLTPRLKTQRADGGSTPETRGTLVSRKTGMNNIDVNSYIPIVPFCIAHQFGSSQDVIFCIFFQR